MIHLIILAAVRKAINEPPPASSHERAYKPGQLLYVYRRDVMTRQHARISHENLPVPLKLENIIIS